MGRGRQCTGPAVRIPSLVTPGGRGLGFILPAEAACAISQSCSIALFRESVAIEHFNE